jgi:hypothetical protein
MGEDKLIGFTDNFEDNSTEAGFQFTFYCDICREGFKTRFIEAKTYKKGRFFKGLGSFISTAADLTGHGSVSSGAGWTRDILSERFEGMSPDWHKEHEKAFESAQNELKQHFQRCPKCTKFVCTNDWNEESGLCTECAPREATEVAAARAQKMVQDIQTKAAKTEVFKGKIEARQTLCPKCGKSAGNGKFCNNCGAPLVGVACPKCKKVNPPGTKFCGDCGTKIN